FQKKCLGRMSDAAGEGRTVLFVSHQMEAIQSLCTRAIWLHDGRLLRDGAPNEVIGAYLSRSQPDDDAQLLSERTHRTGAGRLRVAAIDVHDGRGRPLRTGAPASIVLTLSGPELGATDPHPMLRVGISDSMERMLCMLANELTGTVLEVNHEQPRIACHIERLPLVPGRYLINFALRASGVLQDKMFRAAAIDVLPGDFFSAGSAEHSGVFHLPQDWRVVATNPPVVGHAS